MLRAEAWTLPSAATFEKKFDIPMLEGSAGVREMSGYLDETILVSSTWEHLDEIASETSSSWIRIYDGSVVVDEFRVMRVSRVADRPSVHRISGPQRNGVMEWIGVYPFSTQQQDWTFGGDNLLRNPSFEDNTAVPIIYHLWHDGTGGSFTLSDGTDTTNPIAWDDGILEIEAVLQDDITAITDVFVAGSGTEASPFVIEFATPPVGVTLTANFGLLTGGSVRELVLEQAGEYTPTGWEPNQHVLPSRGDHLFGNPNIFEISDEQASDGTFSVKIDQPLGYVEETRSHGFAGVQQTLNVKPGGTYQARGDFYPTDGDDTFYLTLRSFDNEHIASSTGGITPGTLTPNQWNTEPVVDVVIPDHIDQIIFRYAQGGTSNVNNNPGPWYADNAYFAEGSAATTYTRIIRLLLEAAQTRGTATWLELDATDAADTNSTVLSDISFTAYTGDNAHMGHVMDDGRAMSYHWRIVPAADAQVITPAGTTSHVLQIFYDPDGEVEDLTVTSGGPSVTTGGKIEEAETITRSPGFTTLELLGADTLTLEDTDATLEANMGRIERLRDAEHLADVSSLQQLADGMFADQASNLVAATAIVLSSDSSRPLIDYTEGSKIWWQFPGFLDNQARVVRRVAWTHRTTTRYEVQGSTVYSDETALARAVDRLLNQLRRRRGSTKPAPQFPGGGGGGAPTFVVAPIGSPSVDRADFICDGNNDEREIIEAGTACVNAGGGRVLLAEGVYNVTTSITFPGDNVSLVGMGPGATVVKLANSANVDVILLSDKNHITLSGFTVDGNKANNTSGRGIQIQNSGGNHWLENLEIVNCSGNGVAADAAITGDVYMRAIRSSANGGNGFFIESARTTLTDCVSLNSGGPGFFLDGNDDQIMVGCWSDNAGSYGIRLGGIGAIVIGCFVRASGDHGIFSGPGASGIYGNNIYNASGSGIRTQASTNEVIVANRIHRANNHGIWLNSSDSLVANNWIHEPGRATTNTYDGIFVAGTDGDRNRIWGNLIIGAASSPQPRYGINVSASTCDDNIYVGNDVGDAANYGTGKYNDAGTGTINTWPGAAAPQGDNF